MSLEEKEDQDIEEEAEEKVEVTESEEIKQGLNIWRTVYSDMSTNLTLFFLILFAFTRLSASKREELLQALSRLGQKVEVAQEEIVKQETDELTRKLEKVATVEIKEEEIVINLPSPVLFDLGKAELKEQAKNILSEIASSLRSISGDVVIEGHTDNLPIFGGKYRSNWELSAARAFSVRDYLIKEGISEKRISCVGYGEYKPVAANDTEENRAKNRRIEIKVVRK
ncbi:MAG: flagellar motor protein MotB [Endomicrobia bacterium]|nr:flagellar motor protein MotB [Endomicrobiia bacterium]MDW8055412.1 flagellar motor protein MotB [Elusimicrobiota bacterium]